MDSASSVVMAALSTIRDVQNLSHQFGTKILIARGGYSEVYRAEWFQSGAQAPANVCYKVLKPPISNMPSVVEEIRKSMKHLKREMRAWKDLDHENIVKFIGFAIEVRGAVPEAALVSEWCSNKNLVEYLDEKPTCRRLPLLLDVARGLAYLHERKPVVVHGDLKPLNVLISEAGRAKLCDFGLSLIADGLTTGYTSSGPAFTLRYCAPELVESGDKTTSGDIYSFACICTTILFNQGPFPSLKYDAQLLDALKSGRPPWDWKQSSVEKILSNCCAVSPDARPTMGEAFGSLVDTCAELDSSSSFEISDLKPKLLPPVGFADGSADSSFVLSGDRTDPKPATLFKNAAIEVVGQVAPVSTSPDLQNGISGEKQNLHNALSNLGRHSEALPSIEESVKLYRQLVAVDPRSYTLNLAGSLNNLYVALLDLGRHSEALPFIEESVQLYRHLVAIDPGLYIPDLAMSLTNLHNTLSILDGRPHSSTLVNSVENLRNVISNLGRYSEAQVVPI